MARKPRLDRGITMHGDKYRVRVHAYGKKWHVGNFDTITAAREALHRERDASKSDDWIPPVERRRIRAAQIAAGELTRITVSQWSETWLDNLETKVNPNTGRRIAEGTIVSRRSILKTKILPVIGDLPLADVTPLMIDGLVAQVASEPAKRVQGARRNGSVRNVVLCLKAMFNAAVEVNAGGIIASPVKVKTPPSSRIEVGCIKVLRQAS